MSNVIQFPGKKIKTATEKEFFDSAGKEMLDTFAGMYERDRAAQREYNLHVSKMAERAALGVKFWAWSEN